MQEATDHLTLASEAEGLNAAALRAEAWAGEPFLHPEEDPGTVLAPGTARRRALDEAEAGAELEEEEDELGVHLEEPTDELQLPETHAGSDPGASRRYRFR